MLWLEVVTDLKNKKASHKLLVFTVELCMNNLYMALVVLVKCRYYWSNYTAYCYCYLKIIRACNTITIKQTKVR